MRNRSSLHAPLVVLFVSAAALTAASCSLVLGIGDPSLDGSGGKGGSDSAMASTGASSMSANSGGTDGGGGAEVTYPCAPSDPVCNEVESDCLAVYNNKGRNNFALRFSEIVFDSPAIFNAASMLSDLDRAVTMKLPQCNLDGWGSLSWLLQIDWSQSNFRFGAAKIPSDPHDGYNFINETIGQDSHIYDIASVSGNLHLDGDGTFYTDLIETMFLPGYLNDPMGKTFFMHLHKVQFIYKSSKLSPDRNCIGHYNKEGLQPSNECMPSFAPNIPRFVTGGRLVGYTLLQDADEIIVTWLGLSQSLCFMFTGSDPMFGDGGNPRRCKRDNGKVVFQGDWCSNDNTSATTSCHDSMRFDVRYAASGVGLK